ncbi:hypothetical protein Hanom_Chr13g01195731 [Helianthus anomalus]
MPAMVNHRETMTVLNMTVVQLKTFQLQLKMLQLHVQVVDSDADRSTSESDSSQVRVDESKSYNCDRCDSCVGLNVKLSDLQSKYDDLQSKFDVTFIQNQHLIVDLTKCTEANMFREIYEKEFKKIIETLKKDKTDLTKMVSKKQTEINLYMNRLELMQKEMACVKSESEAIRLKLDR